MRRARLVWLVFGLLAALPISLAALTEPALGADGSRAMPQTITVVNATHLPSVYVRREERALRAQAEQVRRYWHTPLIRFGRGGWNVFLVPGTDVASCGDVPPAESGCHYTNEAGSPQAFVGIGGGRSYMSDTFSHEVIEMLVDPYADRYENGRLVEIADPVEGEIYTLEGESVSDFALPAYFTTAQIGQLDFLNVFASSCLYPAKARGCFDSRSGEAVKREPEVRQL
jgi:hypothetical protein